MHKDETELTSVLRHLTMRTYLLTRRYHVDHSTMNPALVGCTFLSECIRDAHLAPSTSILIEDRISYCETEG